MFLASLFLCGYYISNVYVKWRTSPVIVSLDKKQVSVKNVPFPSVTICPQKKSKASIYSLYGQSTDKWVSNSNLTEEFLYGYAEYEDIATLCRSKYYFKQGIPSKHNNNYSNVTKGIYYHVSPSPKDTIRVSLWHGYRNSKFTRVLTKEGVCFNFNSVSAVELFRNSSILAINVTESNNLIQGWNSETGYKDSEPSNFPYSGSVNKARPDLELLLVADIRDRDILCNSEFTGYKIYLHNPLDLPQSSLYYYAALDDQATSLAIDVNIMKTSDSLIHYRPEVRQCYFPQEKYLKFFKIYTAKNCEMECLTNITLKVCGCVGLHMPHYNGTTKICKRNDLECMSYAHEKMVEREMNVDWDVLNEKDTTRCRCLPPCNNIEYDADVLRTNFNSTEFLINFSLEAYDNFERQYVRVPLEVVAELFGKTKSPGSKPPLNVLNEQSKFISPKLKYSKLNVYFKKPLIIPTRRSELFGWTDFVADVGGLLGLFLGFSVLSIVEILYFLTVKIWIALKQDTCNPIDGQLDV